MLKNHKYSILKVRQEGKDYILTCKCLDINTNAGLVYTEITLKPHYDIFKSLDKTNVIGETLSYNYRLYEGFFQVAVGTLKHEVML